MQKRVLIIKLGALGDIVQAEGAMHDLRLHHPEAEITVLTTPAYERLMRRCPWVDRVILDQRHSRLRLDKMVQLRRRLRAESFSIVYDLQQVGRTDFYYRWFFRGISWLGGARGCSLYCRRPEDRCAADHFKISFEAAGIDSRFTLKSDVSWMADNADDILKMYGLTEQYVVLIPGCSPGHPEKRWPYFAELARELLAGGRRVVTVPGPDEMELCAEISGDMLTDEGRYLDYFKLAGVLKRAGFVVGNDTGPTHIAAHLRRPGLVLFSSHVKPLFTGIQHSRFAWLEAGSLADLTVRRVLEAIPALPGPMV